MPAVLLGSLMQKAQRTARWTPFDKAPHRTLKN
jgi:hypothetical protein